VIPDFELATSLRAASLTVHACRQTIVEPWGVGVTIERLEQPNAASPQTATPETYPDLDATKVVRGVLSAPGSPA
jgi:hypothetical protein